MGCFGICSNIYSSAPWHLRVWVKLCQSELIAVNPRQYCATFAEEQEIMKMAVENGIYVGCAGERVWITSHHFLQPEEPDAANALLEDGNNVQNRKCREENPQHRDRRSALLLCGMQCSERNEGNGLWCGKSAKSDRHASPRAFFAPARGLCPTGGQISPRSS